jgi:DNA-binding response OmpR family regulator
MIEDDDDYVLNVLDRFEWQGFSFSIAETGAEGVALVRSCLPDLVILDIMLETATEGLSVLRQLRADSRTAAIPVVIHSIRADDLEIRLRGLDMGAWYCLYKHKSLSELEAVVRRALEISANGNGYAELRATRHIPVDLDTKCSVVYLNGAPTSIKLSRQQHLLLALFARRAGEVVTRDDIAREVYNAATDNATIDRLVSRLREKLGDTAEKQLYIESAHGRGYRLRRDGAVDL